MHGVLQLNPSELPTRPKALAGVALLSLFIAEDLPIDTPNGTGWLLRTYASSDGLRAVDRPCWKKDPLMPKAYDPALKPFPIRFLRVDAWPSHDDVPVALLATAASSTSVATAIAGPGISLGSAIELCVDVAMRTKGRRPSCRPLLFRLRKASASPGSDFVIFGSDRGLEAFAFDPTGRIVVRWHGTVVVI